MGRQIRLLRAQQTHCEPRTGKRLTPDQRGGQAEGGTQHAHFISADDPSKQQTAEAETRGVKYETIRKSKNRQTREKPNQTTEKHSKAEALKQY